MTRRYGIDTSVLIRLITAQPPDSYTYCIEQLTGLISAGAEILASNQVIGEAYIAVQHHYKVPRNDASQALLQVLSSGLVAPLNGSAALEALTAVGGPGLFDRLISDDYTRAGLEVLTLDRKMATLSGVQYLQAIN